MAVFILDIIDDVFPGRFLTIADDFQEAVDLVKNYTQNSNGGKVSGTIRSETSGRIDVLGFGWIIESTKNCFLFVNSEREAATAYFHTDFYYQKKAAQQRKKR